MKATKKKQPVPQSEQSTRFREIARQLGCDEDEATFDEKLKVIARQKPRTAKSEDED